MEADVYLGRGRKLWPEWEHSIVTESRLRARWLMNEGKSMLKYPAWTSCPFSKDDIYSWHLTRKDGLMDA